MDEVMIITYLESCLVISSSWLLASIRFVDNLGFFLDFSSSLLIFVDCQRC
jgi:hypothetical protein